MPINTICVLTPLTYEDFLVGELASQLIICQNEDPTHTLRFVIRITSQLAMSLS
jgi:hypothetical protein